MTSIETLCPSSDYVFKRHKCELCDFRSQHKWVVRRHIKAKHKDKNQTQTLPPTVSSNVEKENPSQQPLALSNNDDGNNNANTDDTMLVTETETETSQERKRKSNSDNNDVDADIENTNKRQRIENEADPVLPSNNVENQEQIAFNQKYPNNNLDQILSRGKKRKFNPLENVIDQVSTGKKSKSGDIILASGNSGIVEDEHILEGPFNLQLIENFKISIFGPSRSGKTNFLSDLLKNLDFITREKPTNVIYIFTIWQDKLKELKEQGLVDWFLEGNSNIDIELRKYLNSGEKSLVVFDDQASKKEVVQFVGNLFSIHARHSNISVIWVSQIIFDGNNVRNIRKNSDYITIFKCPQDCLDIIHLSRQMTKGKLLQEIYEHVTSNEPYSYVFCDVTQESIEKIKFRSHIFEENGIIRTYIPI
jgi:hypothetical protein